MSLINTDRRAAKVTEPEEQTQVNKIENNELNNSVGLNEVRAW